MNSKNITVVVIIVTVSAMLIGIFIYFGGAGSSVDSDLSVVPTAPGTQNLSRELLSSLASLKDLKLNTDFFKDKAFASLIDYSEDLKEDPLGRENPFLPIE
ncbi:MAG: hypothetical protein Q7S19_02860 [bacterium]|nr:hypothetical protein [bacterium]